jgi:hypothetical protein
MNDLIKTGNEKLKSAEGLYFLSYSETDLPRSVRNPRMTAEQIKYYVPSLMDDPNVKNVSVYSESNLDEIHESFDKDKKQWVSDSITMREYLFGSFYQQVHERFVKESTEKGDEMG